jgi:hypothetical protein
MHGDSTQEAHDANLDTYSTISLQHAPWQGDFFKTFREKTFPNIPTKPTKEEY